MVDGREGKIRSVVKCVAGRVAVRSTVVGQRIEGPVFESRYVHGCGF